jgi:SHS2 domain-containing protein
MSYKFLEHTADVKFRVSADSLQEGFIDSAKALFETMWGNIDVVPQRVKEFSVKGIDSENLLYKFLEEFIVLLDSQDFVVSEIVKLSIDISTMELKAEVVGDDAKNYHFTSDVKAVTYNDMKIEQEGGKFIIVGVFDV